MQSKIVTYSSKPDSLKVSIGKLWKYKTLIWVFAKRDIQVKYAQTYLGIIWSVFKPLLSFIIYVFFFGVLLKWDTGDIAYPVYVLSGLVGWNLFSYIVNNGVLSVHESAELMNKVYFPKAILPLSKVIVGGVEALINLLLLFPLLLYYQDSLSWKIIFIPVALIFNIVCGLALTFLIASFSIKKKDMLQVLPFLLHMAIWLTPVFLSPDIFPKKIQLLFKMNPVANIVDVWRWVLLDNVDFNPIWLINGLAIMALLFISFRIYTRMENKFADYI